MLTSFPAFAFKIAFCENVKSTSSLDLNRREWNAMHVTIQVVCCPISDHVIGEDTLENSRIQIFK